MKRKKNQKGITLVALIITIIVLLILAVVAIRAVTGDGIIAHSRNARDEWAKKSDEENGIMKNYADYITTELEGIPREENLENLTIGTAINANKYGWKVPGYTVTTSEFTSGVWRLFYQDSQYTYLITDDLVGSYKLSDYYEDEDGKYKNGSEVSVVGQRLCPTLRTSQYFTECFNEANVRGYAFLTDSDYWKKYAEGKGAVFAIASPTGYLFAASYNATHKTGGQIEVDMNGMDPVYLSNSADGMLESRLNHEIYSNGGNWWLASVAVYERGGGFGYDYDAWQYISDIGNIFTGRGYDQHAVRPIVCIPTSVFNELYANGMVDE